MTKRLKLIYLAALMFCFSIGAYTWKISHTGSAGGKAMMAHRAPEFSQRAVLVYVGEKPISSQELDFEYSLLTSGVFDSEELTPIPDLGSRFEKELTPLKENLVAGLIERKLLFQFLLKDESFDHDNSGRFVACLKEWQETVAASGELIAEADDQERLKTRLCEKSIITQYLRERIFSKIQIADAEIVEYYKNHASEFRLPPRIVIRQIVLASEKEAIDMRNGLNRANFAARAKQYSITPEAAEGGLLGPFAKGEMPEIFDTAFTMQTGNIYGILKSTYGFHLIMLEKKLSRVDLSLTEATPTIKALLRKKQQEEEYRKWVELAQNAIPVRMPSTF